MIPLQKVLSLDIVGTVAALTLLSSCGATTVSSPPAGAHYVSMGSSFAAGAGTGPAPTGSHPRCRQSTKNYAHIIADRFALDLADVSCSGATSEHLLHPWEELPAQIDAVSDKTQLVSLTIGGNDVRYTTYLIAASCEDGETLSIGDTSFACPRLPIIDEGAFVTLEENLRALITAIGEKAPQARIVFIQYVTLVPDMQCSATRLAEEEADTARTIASRLVAITSKVAKDGGAIILPVQDRTRDHSPCDPYPFSNGFPRDFDTSLGLPWHPNGQGMAFIAEELAHALNVEP